MGSKQVDAQFFTKSSKSIPRMGRRSEDSTLPMSQIRRSLIDTLIDEYGPNLVSTLEAKAAEENRVPPGEIAYRNDQPLDLTRVDIGGSNNDGYELVESLNGESLTRDERSSATKPQNYKESSLAMRALNTNRYIQHLLSGQPLMSYDRLINGQDRNQDKVKHQKSVYDK